MKRAALALMFCTASLLLTLRPCWGERSGRAGRPRVPGLLSDGPWHLLVPSLICSSFLLSRLREQVYGICWVLRPACSPATAVMLHGAGQGFDLAQYYPMKSLWS